MTNKDDKRKQELLRQQQEADRAERQKLLSVAATPPPLEPTLTAETQNWLDTTSGKNGPFDVRNLKALTPHLGLYDNAIRRQEGERMGIGALRLGVEGANPGLTQLLRQQSEDQRQQAAAGQLENAFRATDAQMRGQAFPLMSQVQGRNLNLAGLSNSNSANSTNMFTQFTPRPSMWAQLANSAVQGAAGAATSWATGGLSSLRKPAAAKSPAAPGGLWSSLLHEQGHSGSFAKGGRWDKYLNRPVEVGEEGDELQLADDGSATLFHGRQRVIPRKPGVVIPAPLTRNFLSLSQGPDEDEPRNFLSLSQNPIEDGEIPPISPDRMSGVLSRGPVEQNDERNGIIMNPGRGYEIMPRDPNYPDEIPQQTKRRLEQAAIMRDVQGDPLQRAIARRDEFSDPTAAQFPVSAATKTALYNDGYGAGHNKSPLDPGYVPPVVLSRESLERSRSAQPSQIPVLTRPLISAQSTAMPGMADSRNPADYPNNILPVLSRDRSRRVLPRDYVADDTASRRIMPTLQRTPPYQDSTPFGSSGEPFRPTREHRTQPRDYVADDAAYIRELENQPVKRNRLKSMGIGALEALAGGGGLGGAILGAGVGAVKPDLYGAHQKERKLAEAQRVLGRDVALQDQEMQTRAAQSRITAQANKPPAGSTRIVNAGEYEGIPAGTEIRQTWDPRRQEMVDTLTRGGKPIVSKSPPTPKATAKRLVYARNGQALHVDADGKTSPIFMPDGKTPLTKEDNESGTVQTAYRLDKDGITQIQIERSRETGEWVDSVGPGNKLIVRGQVGRIDPVTGAPVAPLVTAGRRTKEEDDERERNRIAYQTEAGEWAGKEKTFRQNQRAEYAAIKAEQNRIAQLYAEKRSWKPQLLGGRSIDAIQSDIDSANASIKAHRENAQQLQKDADDAAGKATEARRNAGRYTSGPSSSPPTGARPLTRGGGRGKIQPNEDAQIRDYANQFFNGDYAAASKAIQQQRSRR